MRGSAAMGGVPPVDVADLVRKGKRVIDVVDGCGNAPTSCPSWRRSSLRAGCRSGSS
ncbi:hypothetical protein [Amycolatopsis sp. NPDC051903]|uniref:hypothetical protein n=1 Tax=Amycolatopsis sp. NPDC051903 TaxID=3363936 RepID=UPI0037A3705B